MSDRYSRLLAKKKAGSKTGETTVTEKSNANNVSDNTTDPRSDLKNDHFFWEELLINSKQMFPEVFPTLHGIRCSGAGLAKTDTRGLKLLPGENTPKEWEDTKTRWLAPIREQLVKLLQVTSMGRLEDGEFPVLPQPEQTSLRDAWLKGR